MMLTVDAITVAYGRNTAVADVSCHVGQGEIVCLIGANGAGKSTTLNAISGVVPLRRGRIGFDGQPIGGMAADRIVRRGLVQVPEGRQIFPDLTVLENLEMGAYTQPSRLFRPRLDEVLALFPRLAERRAQLAGLMSGGEQQMLAIGRALMARPSLLLLDEPSMGLAPLVVAEIFRTLARLRSEMGLTILLVEQNANAALRLSDRCYVLAGGRVTASGPSADMLRDHSVREAFLGKGHAADAETRA